MDRSRREAFLAGDRPDHVAIFLSEAAVDGIETLAERGEPIDDGVLLVVDGERGRGAFQAATGHDPMTLARRATGTTGEIEPDLSGGVCPDCGSEDARFVFAFAEERNEDAGGLYAEGEVIHAYALCTCGTAYSERWLAGER